MIYSNYTIGGELMHYAKGSEKSGAKYIDKVKTATGKIRYIYDRKISGKYYDNLAYWKDHERAMAKDKANDARKRAHRHSTAYFDAQASGNKSKQQLALRNQDREIQLAKQYDAESERHRKESEEAEANYKASLGGRINTLLEKIQEKKKKK